MEHLGSEKVSELAKHRFYWPYIAKEIDFLCDKKIQTYYFKKTKPR